MYDDRDTDERHPDPRPGMTVFAVDSIDYETADEAIQAVEARGHGTVVKFYIEANQPGRFPECVYRSCAMWSFGNGEPWQKHSIFDGSGAPFEQSRPT